MRSGLRILAGISLATAFALSVLLFRRPSDPLFEGKYASEWADDLLSPDYSVRNQAQAAFQFFGQSGVPQLQILLERRTQPWEPILAQINHYAPFFSCRVYDGALCRQRAAEMLGTLGPKANSAIPELIAKLDADQAGGEVERALVRIGRESESALRLALHHHNVEIRQRAAGLLKEFDPVAKETVLALLEASEDGDARVRRRVASSLGEIRQPNQKIDSKLLRLVDDSSSDVRAAAIEALGKRGAQGSLVSRCLLRSLSDPALIVRLEAARALWKTTSDPTVVVPTLIATLPTTEGWRAAYTLADIGRSASPAVPALLNALRKERVPRPYRTPPSSAFALGHIGPAAIPGLAEVLKDHDSGIRISAVMALSFMGQDARPAVPSLLNLLRDHDAEVRHTAALTLAGIGAEPERIIPGLSECLSAEDIYMRSAAAERLREIAPNGNWVVNPE